MVIRRRFRNFLIPVLLYAVSMPVSGYFIWHAINGERGLKKRAAYEAQMQAQIAVATRLANEKASLEQRIFLMSTQAVDRDLLDEQARGVLGKVAADEILVLLPQPAVTSARSSSSSAR